MKEEDIKDEVFGLSVCGFVLEWRCWCLASGMKRKKEDTDSEKTAEAKAKHLNSRELKGLEKNQHG